MRRSNPWVVVAALALLARPSTAAAAARPDASQRRIAILCYHDVSDDSQAPLQTVSAEFLRRQIRACRAAGWTFLSLAELLDHRQHPEQLPPRSLVLTFDDGYRSFRERALAVLREECVPATLAVITGFVDRPEPGLPPLMGWDELREVARDPLVSIASHSHAIHRYETANPYRDSAPSGATRRYLLAERRYENREEYRARIRADLDSTQRQLRRYLGKAADVLVWPYGMHNEMARGLAAQSGFRATLALGGRGVTEEDLRSGCLPRVMVTRNLRFDAGDATWLDPAAPPMRVADVDLDDVYSPDPSVFDDRVDRLVKRVRALGATHVLLSVCSDTARDGRLSSAWCMNHQVGVRADVWSMVAFRLAQARVKVWARVPTLNLTWVWQQHPEWRICSSGSRGTPRSNAANGAPSLASEWPTRLSPDLPEAQRAAIDFLTDLAVYAPLDGVVFDRDAAMAGDERLTFERAARPRDKAEAIDGLLGHCRDAVRAWRPECRFGRIVDAAVVEVSGVHPGLAQDYARIVRDQDVTIVAADPARTGHDSDAARWVERVGRRAVDRAKPSRNDPTANARVVLELTALDRRQGRWAAARDLIALVAAARRGRISQLGVVPVTPDSGELPASLLEASPTAPLTSGGGP